MSTTETTADGGCCRGCGGEGRTLGRFLSFITPFRRPSARDLYEMVSTRGFTARGLYLNLGYWEQAQTIDEACDALVHLLGQTAALGSADELVDVGFGFGDQDFYWLEHFAPKRIIGLNVTPSQLRVARERAERQGLGERLDFREGSATAMPLPDASADVVTALECAFHFDTREDFFAESWRVLRPGGRLVVADVLPAERSGGPLRRAGQTAAWRATATLLAMPPANAYGRQAYVDKLGAAGFTEVALTPIGEQVFPGWQRAVAGDRSLQQRLRAFGPVPLLPLLLVNRPGFYRAFDYVLVAARKPE